MSNKDNAKIAYVFAPTNMAISAQAKYGRTNPYGEWLSNSRWLDVISFLVPPGQWTKALKIFISPKGFIWLFLRLPYKLMKGKYSLFAAHSRDPQAIIPFLISKLLRKPIIIFDSYYMWIKDDVYANLQWPISRFICLRSTYLSVTSLRVKNFWVSAGISAAKIRFNYKLTSVLEPTQKTLAEAIEIKKNLGHKKIVLFVGRLIQEKGVENLIRAFAKFSRSTDIGLLIVGDGPERNKLEKLCKDLNLLNVIIIWRSDQRAEIDPYFLLCDILVLPSVTLKCHEEWGLVVNEAMSVAKPVIVSGSVGCAYELVKDSVNGYVVPEKNSDALFQAMEKLIINDELRLRMGSEAKKTIANRFTYLHVIEGHSSLQHEALKRVTQ
jgi:glycosyltransferase involved in cell wall biosynthesis